MITSVFIGSSAYALPALKTMCQQGAKPLLVVSQPDKPAGRNLHPQPTPVSVYAKEHHLPLFTPGTINEPESIAAISKVRPDILISASYGGFLGKELRKLAPYRAINLHPSLLPKFRGASPIQRALLNGVSPTGNTIFRLVAQMDAGPIISQQTLNILDNENFSSLHNRLADQAAEMLMTLLNNPALLSNELPQITEQATLCPLIDSSLCQISWKNPAEAIHNKIRAFSLNPGAWTFYRGKKLKLLGALLTGIASAGEPGTINNIEKNTGFTVNCLDNQILITLVQAAGKKVMDAAAFANGARLVSGEKLWM